MGGIFIVIFIIGIFYVLSQLIPSSTGLYKRTPKPAPPDPEFKKWVQKEILSGWENFYEPQLLRRMEKEQVIKAMQLNDPKELPRFFRSNWKLYLQERWMKREGVKKSNQTNIGPKGGTYTDEVTKDGRPYRRYF